MTNTPTCNHLQNKTITKLLVVSTVQTLAKVVYAYFIQCLLILNQLHLLLLLLPCVQHSDTFTLIGIFKLFLSISFLIFLSFFLKSTRCSSDSIPRIQFLGSAPFFLTATTNNFCTIPQRPCSLTILSAKGYKMKTHNLTCLAAHLADLAYPLFVSFSSSLLSTDLSSPFHFFSFFLHSSQILPKFFSFFRRSSLSFSFVAVGLFSWHGLLWVLFLWLWVDFLG